MANEFNARKGLVIGTVSQSVSDNRVLVLDADGVVKYRTDISSSTASGTFSGYFISGSGSNSIKSIYGTNSAGGEYAFVVGNLNLTSGGLSNTFGYNNINDGDFSIVGGHSNNVTSNGGVAFGFNNNISGGIYGVSLGYSNIVTNRGVVLGKDNTSLGLHTTVIGIGNSASGNYSSIVGGNNNIINTGISNVVGGSSNISDGDYNAIFGNNNTSLGYSLVGGASNSSGTFNIIGGTGNTSNSAYALLSGAGNITNGSWSTNIGYFNTNSSDHTHTMGRENTNSGNYSLVTGYFNVNSESYSNIFGRENTNYGQYSIISGMYNTVGTGSFYVSMFGRSNRSLSASNVGVFGLSNSISSDYGFVGGFSNSVAKNYAFGYNNKLNIGIYSFAAGSDNTVTSSYSGAMGLNNTVDITYGFALGYLNTVNTGLGGIAIGTSNTVRGTSSVALGNSNIVSGDYSSIIGGNGLSLTQSNTVLVPSLKIDSVQIGTSINNLGIDSDGNVIIGSSIGITPSLSEVLNINNNTNDQNIIISDDTYLQVGSSSTNWQFKKNSSNGRLEVFNNDEGSITQIFDQEYLHSNGLSTGEMRFAQSYNNSENVYILAPSLATPYITITGNTSNPFQGLKYTADYSANFATHSLIDKNYVDTNTNGVYLPLSGGSMSGYLTASSIETSTQFKAPTYAEFIGATTSFTFDCNVGTSQWIDFNAATGDITLSITNPVQGNTYTMVVVQTIGQYDLTLPSGWWLNDTAPFDFATLANNERAMITMSYINSEWYFAVKKLQSV